MIFKKLRFARWRGKARGLRNGETATDGGCTEVEASGAVSSCRRDSRRRKYEENMVSLLRSTEELKVQGP